MKHTSKHLSILVLVSSLLVQPVVSNPEAAPANKGESITSEQTEEIEDLAPMREFMSKIQWEKSDQGRIGSYAKIAIPKGYQFTESAGTMEILKAYGNLTNGAELGYIAPEDHSWCVIFEFDDCGYVKDDEKNQLDADKILDSLKKGQEQANKILIKQGGSPLELIGWHTPPFYNIETNNLEWAIRLKTEEGNEILNYNTKLLGRKGVMEAALLCDESQLASALPSFRTLLTGYSYNPEESYAAFTSGDKIAEYGLTGLILGGGLLAAAKTGLLAKLWKPIAIGLVAIVAFIKRLFGKKNQA